MIKYLTVILILASFTALNVNYVFSQTKKVVKKVAKDKELIKDGEQNFDVGKQGKSKSYKYTKNGKRYSNRKEIKQSRKEQNKRDLLLKKRKKNPEKKYRARRNPSTPEAIELNKKTKKQYKEVKKKDKESRKNRKRTIKVNERIKRKLS